MKKDSFSKNLIAWYKRNKRDLPWRRTTDPYKIWLSEIILQQTRVAQGLPYYQKFIVKLPTLNDLALAQEHEVLRLWQGLGYYSRARNMHTTARYIYEALGGQFPESFTDLKKLKGIGDYTAAAIASMAFHEKVAVLDGNVYRVLARYFGESSDISNHASFKIFKELATKLLPNTNAGIHNQAIMELGALCCTPLKPNCINCPISNGCFANKNELQGVLPVKSNKVKIKKRFLNYLIIEYEGKFFMKQRGKDDIWAGLYDFVLFEGTEELMCQADIIAKLSTEMAIEIHEIGVIAESKVFKQALTHQRIEAKFWCVKCTTLKPILGHQAYTLSEIEHLPKPILIDNFIKNLITIYKLNQ